MLTIAPFLNHSAALDPSLPQPRRARQKVIALRRARRALRCAPEIRDRVVAVTRPLQEMRAHRVEAMMIGEALVLGEGVETLEPRGRAVNHGDRDGVVEG